MPKTDILFATRLYRALLPAKSAGALNAELETAAYSIAEDDKGGQAWCLDNGYQGYTSYSSLDDLPWRAPVFADLAKALDRHVAAFVKELDWDLQGRRVVLDNIWINILGPGGSHSGHIHPHAVISGTYYVCMPEGASAIRFEDPRLPLMMAAPPRRARARADNRAFVYVAPKPGMVLLWESWLRHEAPPSGADEDRISISFNYALR